MSNHGWVVPNNGNWKAKCGGPSFCKECALEQAEHDLHIDCRAENKRLREALEKGVYLLSCYTGVSREPLSLAGPPKETFTNLRQPEIERIIEFYREVEALAPSSKGTEGK